jgi:hypothetical protein
MVPIAACPVAVSMCWSRIYGQFRLRGGLLGAGDFLLRANEDSDLVREDAFGQMGAHPGGNMDTFFFWIGVQRDFGR